MKEKVAKMWKRHQGYYSLTNTKYKLHKHYHFTEENCGPAGRKSVTLRREKSPNAATRRIHTQLPNSQIHTGWKMSSQSKRADVKIVVPQQMRLDDYTNAAPTATRVARLQTAPSSTRQHPNANYNGQARFSRRWEFNGIRKPVNEESTTDCKHSADWSPIMLVSKCALDSYRLETRVVLRKRDCKFALCSRLSIKLTGSLVLYSLWAGVVFKTQ